MFDVYDLTSQDYSFLPCFFCKSRFSEKVEFNVSSLHVTHRTSNQMQPTDVLRCFSLNCILGHTLCIAKYMLSHENCENTMLIPVRAPCPKCKAPLLWGELIADQRQRNIKNLNLPPSESEKEPLDKENLPSSHSRPTAPRETSKPLRAPKQAKSISQPASQKNRPNPLPLQSQQPTKKKKKISFSQPEPNQPSSQRDSRRALSDSENIQPQHNSQAARGRKKKTETRRQGASSQPNPSAANSRATRKASSQGASSRNQNKGAYSRRAPSAPPASYWSYGLRNSIQLTPLSLNLEDSQDVPVVLARVSSSPSSLLYLYLLSG